MPLDPGHCRTNGPGAGHDLRTEAAILVHCRHPGVVDLLLAEETEAGFTLEVATPEGPGLDTVVLTVDEIAGVVAVLATTVADLHDIGVAHGALAVEVVTIDTGGRPVLGGFSRARWLDGAPGRWPGHDLAQADDRALGVMAASLLDRCAPLAMQSELAHASARWPRWFPLTRWVRGAPAVGAEAVAEWAAAAAAGHVRARRLAAAMAEQVPGARLPDISRAVPRSEGGAWNALDLVPDEEADAAIDAWLHADPRGQDRRPSASRMRHSPVALVAILATIGALIAVAIAVVHPARPRLEPAAATPTTTPPAPAPARASPDASAAGGTAHTARPPSAPATGPTVEAQSQFCLRAAAPCTPARYIDGVLTVGAARFAVGRPGDVVAAGRWTCGTTPTLALLRPSTGELWVFPSWPGGPQSVAPFAVGAVASGRALAPIARGACDALAVTRADGTVVDLGPWQP